MFVSRPILQPTPIYPAGRAQRQRGNKPWQLSFAPLFLSSSFIVLFTFFSPLTNVTGSQSRGKSPQIEKRRVTTAGVRATPVEPKEIINTRGSRKIPTDHRESLKMLSIFRQLRRRDTGAAPRLSALLRWHTLVGVPCPCASQTCQYNIPVAWGAGGQGERQSNG